MKTNAALVAALCFLLKPSFTAVKSKRWPARATLPKQSSMFSRKSPPPKPIPTPCIGVCTLDATGHCEGCHRTIDEIANWGALDDAERAHLMDDVLPRRAAERPPA